jgi:serine/threonine-protein kinase
MMIGETLGPYRVLGKLGEGGMGEVYRARDSQLRRDVALKVLPAEVATDPDRLARFQREAELLAALNHPHVAQIHGIVEAGGTRALVMELVEGETLAARIARGSAGSDLLHQGYGGPPELHAEAEDPASSRWSPGASAPGMPIADVLAIARQVAEALEYAHGRGIIHRDLKPANIMLTPGGAVKVLDFGLAKSAVLPSAGDGSEQATLTRGLSIAGTVLGTASYMSPEQARGEPVDERADVWAFGCVLYEMLAGRRAFPGRTATDVLAAVIKDEPGWDALPPSTPQVVRDLIHRCLDKDAGQRLPDMRAVSGALAEFASGARGSGAPTETSIAASLPAGRVAGRRRGRQVAVAALIVGMLALAANGLWTLVSGGPASPSITSIAVLPLTNVSGKPDDAFFADGMTDVLIANLGSIEALKVISRTSVMAYRGGSKPVREIARELKVDAVIEGSVLRAGDRVRITAQLIDARAGTIMWSETYERDMRDIMALQGDVARAIARRIQTTLAPDVERRLTAKPVRPDVYEDYLKGRYFLYQTTPEGLQKAEEFFNRALEKDPALALAHAGLADVNIIRSFSGLVQPAEALDQARMHAVRAIQLDDQLADAHASFAWISFLKWDWLTAEKEFRRALQLNPGNAVARMNYAQFLAGRGRDHEALREAQRSREVDPLSLPLHTAYAAVMIGVGRYDEALQCVRKPCA